jgi:hypothetical protein
MGLAPKLFQVVKKGCFGGEKDGRTIRMQEMQHEVPDKRGPRGA